MAVAKAEGKVKVAAWANKTPEKGERYWQVVLPLVSGSGQIVRSTITQPE